jgi:hypothetical protein
MERNGRPFGPADDCTANAPPLVDASPPMRYTLPIASTGKKVLPPKSSA